MTYLAERLADLRRYLGHAAHLREQVSDPEILVRDLTTRNDVLHTLLMICQMVIDICGELSARAGLRFADYTEAVANLRAVGGFPEDVVRGLTPLPGFRNVIVHEYVALDPVRVLSALRDTRAIEAFVRLAAAREAAER